MVAIKPADVGILNDVFDMRDGYPLDFSNTSFAEFFDAEFGIDIYDDKYAVSGTSKANRLRTFVRIEGPYLVGQLLRKLWEHRASYSNRPEAEEARDKERLFALITRIETAQSAPALSELSGTAGVLNFDTVSRDIQRALESAQRDPESAVTSACSTVESVCRSILIELAEPLPAKKDIKGLFNAVKKPLNLSPDRTDIDPQIADDVRKSLAGWLLWSRALVHCAPTVAMPMVANGATAGWKTAIAASARQDHPFLGRRRWFHRPSRGGRRWHRTTRQRQRRLRSTTALAACTTSPPSSTTLSTGS